MKSASLFRITLILVALLATACSGSSSSDGTGGVNGVGGAGGETGFGGAGGQPAELPEPDEPLDLTESAAPFDLGSIEAKYYEAISYGPHEENLFDIYLPESEAPTSLLVYIHGGGFTGGSRDTTNHEERVLALLAEGVAYASIDYRLLQSPDAEGVIKPLSDSTRALQFLRYHANQLNIDRDSVILMGGSAGAGTSLWIAFNDDMADRESEDPETTDLSWDRRRFEERLWPELAAFVPAFDRLRFRRGWAGLYAVNTLDGNAILGEWPELSGFYLANGFSGHGLQQAPAVGRFLAERILGREPILDLSVFGPERVVLGRPLQENLLV
jgi:hypothetical protein